jgi:hypothetical protein
MSPEQLLGESITDASDVYSLGIMGYELLTLKAPYEGNTSVQLVTAHLKKEPIPLLTLRPDADPFLGELLERCLSKNPQHRPRASEIAKALAQVSEEPHSPGLRDSGSFAHQTLAEVAQDVSAFEGFFLELRRRRVINVVILYAVVALALLGGADDALRFLKIPGDSNNQMAIVVALTLGAFPVVLVLSWMFDVSSKGIRRTASDVSGVARAKLGFMKVAGVLLSLLLSGVLGWWIWPRP